MTLAAPLRLTLALTGAEWSALLGVNTNKSFLFIGDLVVDFF